MGIDREDPADGDLLLDVARGGVDEALHDPGVGLLDAGVVGRRVRERPHHRAVVGVDADDALERLARELRPFAGAAQPALGHLVQLGAEVLDHAQDEVVAVAEVDVERRPGEVRAAHDLVDSERAEGLLAQESLGGCDDLSLRDLWGPPAPPCGNLPTLIPRVHEASLARRFTILEPS